MTNRGSQRQEKTPEAIKRLVAENNRLHRRVNELLEANNRYQQEARAASLHFETGPALFAVSAAKGQLHAAASGMSQPSVSLTWMRAPTSGAACSDVSITSCVCGDASGAISIL